MAEEKITKKDIKDLLNIQTKQIEQRFVKQEKQIEQRFVKQEKQIEQRFVKQEKQIEQRFVKQEKQIEQRFVKQEKQIEQRLNNQTNAILSAVEERLESKADREITDKILTNQDKIITKLDTLLQEKTVGDEQDKRKTKVLEIHNNALKSNKILSSQQSAEIDALGVF